MDFGESQRRKLEEQSLRVPIPATTATLTTPLEPVVPRPEAEPIWTPGMANQLYSHSNGIPAGFDPSPCPEINNWSHHRSEPVAAFTYHNVPISFPDFPSSSNAIAQLLTLADTPLPYSNVTNEELLSQFIPPYNSQFNPTYTSFDHHQLLSLEQPFLNTVHNQYQDLPGSSHFGCCSKTFPQVEAHAGDAIDAETRQKAVAPITFEERKEEVKNAPATKCYNTNSKIYDPTNEIAAVSAPRKENHNHKMKTSLDFDLNKTPQSKTTRRKHRPKVIKEDEPKRTTKKVTAESGQPKENPTKKRKTRLNTASTQTEETGEWNKPLTRESAKKTSRKSLNFETSEQANSLGTKPNLNNSSSSRNWMADHDGLQECGLQAVGSKRKQPGKQADNSTNLVGARHNGLQVVCLDNAVQFPNVQKKRRSEKGRISKTSRKSSFSTPQSLEYTLSLGQRRPTKRRTRASPRTHASPADTAKQILGDAERPQTCIDALVADMRASLTKKKRTKRRTPVNSAYTCKNEMQQGKWKNIHTVDALTEQFRFLNIDGETQELESHGQNMLVPYNQQNGTIVPYKGDLTKKKGQRPKVDLDEETTRVWNLLLADINSSGVDGSDADKAKKWEREREVFRGRADSFIARMHLVQGDRGFSKWKGSVVDSVVGVFLTQNVSDHLSSSAFMSLAARFPLKSSSNCQKESTSAMVNEPKVCTVEPEEHEDPDKKISDQSVCEMNSMTSGDFSIDQNPEKIGSFSDSNSEIEDLSSSAHFNIYHNRTSFRELLEMASSTMLPEVNSQRSKTTENFRETHGHSIGLNLDNLVEHLEKSDVAQDCVEASITKESPLETIPESSVLEINYYDPLKIEVPSSASSKDKDENDEKSTFPRDSNSQAANVDSQGQTQDPMKKARKQDFSDPNNKNRKKDSAPAKSKSKKRAEEKKNNFDWDSLRIQAQARAGKREKTENTMDSVDWDAVRRADINEISKTIKERGMNNMLAERIQDFLNLLVDKHDGIDLEWLRDVPPDQAKEFLLSIKGLGLKSVECVRLLTLHHLAFPVDTNVGRIAVRLGWVPIQPLPDSTHLHLLELYPVLESVQKYLWPRLCKLDQKTLYELHYQMITFGKVFCTKSKPNCNACPMKGDCRHFASAFASTRLALPAPEEKRIVITSESNATEKNPSSVINQIPLLLPGNTIREELQQTTLIVQPIVEEPSTPEPECSRLSGDIEDAFNEESREIPTIKLDVAKFTSNLQDYMQQNMELQEGEMSKALVALHPDAARIPAPKLKNVSRLRTEHYVYELPDSHPLLNGWERREPDDPGKYLLAIWTPGEAADTIQPPERKCSSQDCGQLCNENECFACNSLREANSQIVRGTVLIPCRTATRGSFPLNGTYFQVNEVFADNDSSINPISVPRSWIWNLHRRTVYFGTSVSSILKGLSTEKIQQCFWRGFVCVRGFDRETRAPRPLLARLHFSASKTPKKKDNTIKKPKSAKKSKQNKKQPE